MASSLETETKQLTTQQAATQPTPAQQAYQAHKTTIDQLGAELPKRQQQYRDQQLADQALTADATTLDGLRAQYGAQLMQSQPMRASDQETVAQLLAQQRQLNATQTAITDQRHQLADQLNAAEQADNDAGSGISVTWLAAGIAVVVLAVFFLSGVLRSVGGALGVIVAAYGIFKPMLNNSNASASRTDLLSEQIDKLNQQLKTVNAQLTDASGRLETIGAQYHLTGMPATEWLDLQPVLKQYGVLMAQSATDQQRLLDLEQRLMPI